MRTKLLRAELMLAGLIAASFAAPALAQQPAQIESDLRCVAVLSAAVSTAQGEARGQMAAAVMYFIGRIDGEAPKVDLQTELKRIVPTINAQMMTDDGKRCGAILVEKGTKLQAMGAQLQSGETPAPKK